MSDSSTPITTADPRASYLAHRDDIHAAIRSVLEGPDHILGAAVESFERAFADFVGVRHAVGVASGTDALHLAVRALGIEPGEEVITVSHTSVATVAAIEMAGAMPVLVDVEEPWLTIDPGAVEAAITPRTQAVIAVHLYGQPANLDALQGLCERRGLRLIEDCAQAHGALWRDRPVGGFGDVACFSFYPSKNLGTVGDGGMVVTDDGELAHRVSMLRQYGWTRERVSEIPGWNSRLGPLQAAILLAKLPHLHDAIATRRQIASAYRADLPASRLLLPTDREHGRHAYHLFVVRCASWMEREHLLGHLAEAGVAAGVHYAAPVHTQPAYRDRVRTGPLAVTKTAAAQVLSLPLYPELSEAQQETIVRSVRAFCQTAR